MKDKEFYHVNIIRTASAKHSSLFCPIVSDKNEMFYYFDTIRIANGKRSSLF